MHAEQHAKIHDVDEGLPLAGAYSESWHAPLVLAHAWLALWHAGGLGQSSSTAWQCRCLCAYTEVALAMEAKDDMPFHHSTV